MQFQNGRISRRAVLKGAGVSLCLPLLDAMEPLIASAAGRQSAAKAPVRLAAIYMPNGVNPHTWTPGGFGSDFTLSPALSPLEKVKSNVLVFSELMNKQSIEGDGHYVKVAPWLTGTHITKTTGSDLRCGGVSMDQLVAQRLGNLTPLPSLELSIEPVTMGVDTNVGFTRLYGSHISWSTPTTPVTREINPQLAFDRLFRSNSRNVIGAKSAPDASVLDAVMDEAKSLNRQVGAADRSKLEEYYDSVRSVEKRIAFDAARRKGEYLADPEAMREVEKLGGRIKDYYQDPARLSERKIDHTDQVRLMLDIMVLAFWTDSTRVATFMYGNEVSGKNFSFLPGVTGSHHEISHHENNKTKLDEYTRINTWHVQQVAYMLEKMQGIREGAGTLLDQSLVLFGSGMKDGNAHSPYNLPVIVAGKGGGKIASGRHLVYEKNTPMCNLYRGMLGCFDIPAEHFGDSSEVLHGLYDPAFRGLTSVS